MLILNVAMKFKFCEFRVNKGFIFDVSSYLTRHPHEMASFVSKIVRKAKGQWVKFKAAELVSISQKHASHCHFSYNVFYNILSMNEE